MGVCDNVCCVSAVVKESGFLALRSVEVCCVGVFVFGMFERKPSPVSL